MNIDQTNTTRAIKKLEKAGYVTVTIDELDRRNKKIYLTNNGHKIIEPIMTVLHESRTTMLEGVTSNERKQLFYLLQKIEGNVEKGIQVIKEKKDE